MSDPAPPFRPIFRGHVTSLDGLRGLAVLLVLFVHLWRPETRTAAGAAVNRLARGGWAGVDLFFVLSGFLITGLLIDSRGEEGYFRRFFARRALRIIPLYALFLAVSLALLPLWFERAGFDRVPSFGNRADAAAWPWYAFFVSNVWMALQDRFSYGYTNGLTWSLAVEEQFYLLWPGLILLCPPARLPRVLAAVFLGAVATRGALVALGAGWLPVFVSTPCRMDALAAGGMLAAYLRSPGFRPEVWRRFVRLALGAALPAAAAWLMLGARDPREGRMFQVFGYSLLAVAGAGLLAAALDGDRRFLRPLRGAFLVSFGRYSYGIYLFHLVLFTAVLPVAYRPVLALLRVQFLERAFWLVAGAAGSWLLAWGLYHLWEAPFLRLKERFRAAPPPVSRPEAVPEAVRAAVPEAPL